jgi:two-component system NarL family response regulator
MTTRILLVEDHRLVREAVRDALSREADFEIIGEVGSSQDAIRSAQTLNPDVIVLDIGLPDFSGVELTHRLRHAGCTARIVALSAYAEKHFVTEMLRAGAAAYVSKNAAGTELFQAIRAVERGQNYVSPDVTGNLFSQLRDQDPDSDLENRKLGRREREVLRLIAQGQRSPEIADQLHISIGTVEAHRRNIMRKLDLHSVAELTKYALREGIASL